MRSTRVRGLAIVGLLSLFVTVGQAKTAAEGYRAMGLKTEDVLSGTTLNSRVIPGASKQLVMVTTYLTGKREKDQAVNVRLDVFETDGQKLVPLYSRDFGQENEGPVGDGNLELVDLDRDGVNEIIVSYTSYREPLIEQTLGEVILHEKSGFRTAWFGPLKYDATRAARDVPQERRDRYHRELDLPSTMRTRGVTLFVNKTMISVAGERLSEPKVVQETFPLRQRDVY